MRNYRELSDEEIAELGRLYPTTCNRKLSKMFDVSFDAISKTLRRKYGWKKSPEIRKINFCDVVLTDKQVDWLKKHYKHTRNLDIQEKLNIGDGTLHRLARKYGLKKTKQFIRKIREEAKVKAMEVVKNYNLMPKGYKPDHLGQYRRTGISNVKYFGKKKWEDMKRRSHASRNETIRMERIRIKWGLPQKTNLVLKDNSRLASCHRFLFKKKGYITYRGDPHVYYDKNTERSETMESNAWAFGLVVLPFEDQ